MPLDGSPNGRPPFDIGKDEGIHDGHLEAGGLYFTTVNGCVVRFDSATGERTTLDLNTLTPAGRRPPARLVPRRPAARGDRAWVGFSRIRYTQPAPQPELDPARLPRDASTTASGRPASPSTTSSGAPCAEQIDLEPVGLGAVFSIHQA